MLKIDSKLKKTGQMILLGLLLGLSACDRATPLMSSTSQPQANGQNAPSKNQITRFPDIPIPQGASIDIDKTVVFGSKPWFGQLVLISNTNISDVFDFYRNNLPQYQWQELASVRAKTSILTYSSENRVLFITIEGSTLLGSDITMLVSPKGTNSTAPQDIRAPDPLQRIQ